MNTFDLYKDIETRTNGEIYLGVVGPVRSGKSTFIKRFMDLVVLPRIKDENVKKQTMDELPQSASGKMIMTTEPKFIPKEAAEVNLSEEIPVKIRMIDCVGYMIEGATGFLENEEERKVKTPWFEEEIPFTQAASIGTKKVIYDHATIGIVVTTDGTIGEIPRENYRQAEERTIRELKNIGKPFVVLLNTVKPYSESVKKMVVEMEEEYKVPVLSVNCEQLKEEDIYHIMEKILYSFPVCEVDFYIPKWVEMLPKEHKVKEEIRRFAEKILERTNRIQDFLKEKEAEGEGCINDIRILKARMDTGRVEVEFEIEDSYYYEMLSELTGTQIRSEYDMIQTMRELAIVRKEYDSVRLAIQAVRQKGYGVVDPLKEEIQIEDPIIIKQGNKYGVKIHSKAPSIHMIRADIETEISPIVGSEQQAKDLIDYISEMARSEGGIWRTNIFGKSIEELIADGMKNKISMINEESQQKLQDTMQKIVNDSTGGLVCIII